MYTIHKFLKKPRIKKMTKTLAAGYSFITPQNKLSKKEVPKYHKFFYSEEDFQINENIFININPQQKYYKRLEKTRFFSLGSKIRLSKIKNCPITYIREIYSQFISNYKSTVFDKNSMLAINHLIRYCVGVNSYNLEISVFEKNHDVFLEFEDLGFMQKIELFLMADLGGISSQKNLEAFFLEFESKVLSGEIFEDLLYYFHYLMLFDFLGYYLNKYYSLEKLEKVYCPVFLEKLTKKCVEDLDLDDRINLMNLIAAKLSNETNYFFFNFLKNIFFQNYDYLIEKKKTLYFFVHSDSNINDFKLSYYKILEYRHVFMIKHFDFYENQKLLNLNYNSKEEFKNSLCPSFFKFLNKFGIIFNLEKFNSSVLLFNFKIKNNLLCNYDDLIKEDLVFLSFEIIVNEYILDFIKTSLSEIMMRDSENEISLENENDINLENKKTNFIDDLNKEIEVIYKNKLQKIDNKETASIVENKFINRKFFLKNKYNLNEIKQKNRENKSKIIKLERIKVYNLEKNFENLIPKNQNLEENYFLEKEEENLEEKEENFKNKEQNFQTNDFSVEYKKIENKNKFFKNKNIENFIFYLNYTKKENSADFFNKKILEKYLENLTFKNGIQFDQNFINTFLFYKLCEKYEVSNDYLNSIKDQINIFLNRERKIILENFEKIENENLFTPIVSNYSNFYTLKNEQENEIFFKNYNNIEILDEDKKLNEFGFFFNFKPTMYFTQIFYDSDLKTKTENFLIKKNYNFTKNKVDFPFVYDFVILKNGEEIYLNVIDHFKKYLNVKNLKFLDEKMKKEYLIQNNKKVIDIEESFLEMENFEDFLDEEICKLVN